MRVHGGWEIGNQFGVTLCLSGGLANHAILGGEFYTCTGLVNCATFRVALKGRRSRGLQSIL